MPQNTLRQFKQISKNIKCSNIRDGKDILIVKNKTLIKPTFATKVINNNPVTEILNLDEFCDELYMLLQHNIICCLYKTPKDYEIKTDLMILISKELKCFYRKSSLLNHHTDTQIIKIICNYIESKLFF